MRNRPRSLKISVRQNGQETSLTLDSNNRATVQNEASSSSTVFIVDPKPVTEFDIKELLRYFRPDEIENIWKNIMNFIKETKPQGEMIDHLKISYKYDLDILDIHRQVLLYFHHQYYKVPKLRLSVGFWKIKISDIDSPQTKRKSWAIKIEQTEAKINEILSGNTIKEYIDEVLPYIDLYNRTNKNKTIMKISQDPVSSNQNQDKIHHLIIQIYITKTKKYFNLDIYRQLTTTDICPSCQKEIDDDYIDFHGNCSCGYVPRLLNVRTIKSVKKSTDSEYEDLANFVLAMSRQEGSQNVNLPESLFDDLDDFFISKNLPNSQQVRCQILNSNGSRGNTNIKMLEQALKDTGHSSLYVEGKLIASIYWGWKIYNLSHIKEEAIDIYKISQPFYNRRKGLRESSMNVYFRLYKTIQLIQWRKLKDGIELEYKFRMRDFRVIETPAILCDLEDIWRCMCYDISKQYSNWAYLPSEK